MNRLTEALAALDLAVDQLEDTVAGQMAASRQQTHRRPARPLRGDDMNSLFSEEHLSSVKQRLDDAIERLESALESADVPR